MQIKLRGSVQGLSYREVIHEGQVIAAIWKTRGDGNERFSVTTPTKDNPRLFSTLSGAKRWVRRYLGGLPK